MSQERLSEQLATAGRVLAQTGLVTAFGHVSARLDAGTLVITPPRPPGRLGPGPYPLLPVRAGELPPDVPREAWIHTAIAAARPDVGAVCRAQPPSVAAASAAGFSLVPLHGQGALLGGCVPVHKDARLVRQPAMGRALADALGDGFACVLKGNGAVTVGATVGEAVARMWILAETSRITLLAACCGGIPLPLSPDEQKAWAATGPELLERIWQYLSTS
ncbi:class II aldolase/adducin family protein [Actinocrispum sp. NPDC049592]|uniref:class II aldolase/adducin family protein n=1 Tax=Actinocrispum sp. NPDC049592 TaxID=3154835 RepID=UPI00342948EE